MRRLDSAPAKVHAALWVAAWAATALGAGPAKTAPPARHFPRQDLVAYAEFQGLNAHEGLWKKTAAYRLLTETTAGAMLADVAAQLSGRALSAVPGQALSADDLGLIARTATRSGFALGVVRPPGRPGPEVVGLVLRGAGGGGARAAVDKLLAAGGPPNAKPRTDADVVGRAVTYSGEGLAWWAEGDDLVIRLGASGTEGRMMAAFDGARPDATGLPLLAELSAPRDGFTPVGFAFAEAAVLGPMPPQAAGLGLDKVRRVDYRWGFRGEALVTVTRVVSPAPRAGLLAAFDLPAFGPGGLPPLPAGLAGFATVSLDPAGLYDRVAVGFASADRPTLAAFEAFEAGVREATGVQLRNDVLSHLGPRLTFYTLPVRADAPTNALGGLAMGLAAVPRAVAVVEVKDPGAFARVFDGLMAKTGATFAARAAGTSRPPALRVRPLPGVAHGYALTVSAPGVPLPAGFRPTAVLGKSALILATTPEAARGALALEGRAGGLPEGDPLARTAGRLPDGMLFLSLDDAGRSLLPEAVANLPGLIQLFGATYGRRAVGAPGNFLRLDVDADKVPAPDDLRPFLFPSVYLATADKDGFEVVSREAFPAFNPAAVAPLLAAAVLPGFQSARSARRRAQSVNNLKQIGLALHNYHSVKDHFPGAILDKDGKPLLSWRVAILPYLEQQALYDEFKLDEPWDSPNNKPLVARMPAVFALPDAPAGPGETFYQGFAGAGTAFDPKVEEGVGLRDVTDGSSNTLGVVEARKAAVWTKPDGDLPFDPEAPPEKARDLAKLLGGHSPGGFNALLLDGSVRFLKDTINPIVLRALITRSGGEVISADSY